MKGEGLVSLLIFAGKDALGRTMLIWKSNIYSDAGRELEERWAGSWEGK